MHHESHFKYWLTSLAKVRVFIGFKIKPVFVMPAISALSSDITEAVTKTMGISRVSLS
jgi:hypothetical protein